MDEPVFERVPNRECQSCAYFVYRADYDDAGECRRRAPQVYPSRVNQRELGGESFYAELHACAMFPSVGNDDWCGEFIHATLADRGPRIPLPTLQGIYAIWQECWKIEFVHKDPSGFFWFESSDDVVHKCEKGEYVLMRGMGMHWKERPMPSQTSAAT